MFVLEDILGQVEMLLSCDTYVGIYVVEKKFEFLYNLRMYVHIFVLIINFSKPKKESAQNWFCYKNLKLQDNSFELFDVLATF